MPNNRRPIYVSAETYQRIKARAKRLGTTYGSLVDQAVQMSDNPDAGPTVLAPFGAPDTIHDGCGNSWSVYCQTCGDRTMRVTAPGQAECGRCDHD